MTAFYERQYRRDMNNINPRHVQRGNILYDRVTVQLYCAIQLLPWRHACCTAVYQLSGWIKAWFIHSACLWNLGVRIIEVLYSTVLCINYNNYYNYYSVHLYTHHPLRHYHYRPEYGQAHTS